MGVSLSRLAANSRRRGKEGLSTLALIKMAPTLGLPNLSSLAQHTMYSPDLHNIHTLGHLAGFIYPFTQSSNIIQRLSMPFPNSFDVTDETILDTVDPDIDDAVVGVMGVLSLLMCF